MYDYIIGTVTGYKNNAIVLDNNGCGYLIYVSNPYVFDDNKEYKVYVYQQIKEDEHLLFGFKTLAEKELFLKLINVKGLGPKTAMPMLATGSVNGIKDAIDRENVLYLKKFPKVGDKLARQMILDLKGKLANVEGDSTESTELVEVLENLGYKTADIKKILPKVNKELRLEDQIKEALKLMLR